MIAVALVSASAFGAGGARLDPSFGEDGVVVTRSSPPTTPAFAIAKDRSGRILAVGGDSDMNLVIVRLLPSGELDPSFGDGGRVRFGAPDTAFATGVTVQSDGRIVVVGSLGERDYSARSGCVIAVRLLPDGSEDSSFGTNERRPGRVITCAVEHGLQTAGLQPRSVALQANGKIIVGGIIRPNRDRSGGFVLRYKPNGTIDRSFQGGRRTRSKYQGRVQILAPKGHYSGISEVRALSRGRILAAGWDRGRFMLARFRRDGTLDRSFARDGKAALDLDGRPNCECSVGNGLARDRRGRILLVGDVGPEASTHLALARFRRNGRLDRRFAKNGVARLRDPSFATGFRVAVQPDGRIVVAGEKNFLFLVARFLPGGRRDKSFFGDSVFADYVHGDYAEAWDVMIDSAGRIVAGGGSYSRGIFALLRFLPR